MSKSTKKKVPDSSSNSSSSNSSSSNSSSSNSSSSNSSSSKTPAARPPPDAAAPTNEPVARPPPDAAAASNEPAGVGANTQQVEMKNSLYHLSDLDWGFMDRKRTSKQAFVVAELPPLDRIIYTGVRYITYSPLNKRKLIFESWESLRDYIVYRCAPSDGLASEVLGIVGNLCDRLAEAKRELDSDMSASVEFDLINDIFVISQNVYSPMRYDAKRFTYIRTLLAVLDTGCRSRMKLYVNTPSGKVLTLFVHSHNTIKFVLQQLILMGEIPYVGWGRDIPYNLIFETANLCMQIERTLQDHHVPNESFLDLRRMGANN